MSPNKFLMITCSHLDLAPKALAFFLHFGTKSFGESTNPFFYFLADILSFLNKMRSDIFQKNRIDLIILIRSDLFVSMKYAYCLYNQKIADLHYINTHVYENNTCSEFKY